MLRTLLSLFGRREPAAPVSTRAITYDQLAAIGAVTEATAAGVSVSVESALTSSPVFAATRIISAAVGSLPLCLYRRESDGGRERATGHPAYHVLHDSPNTEAVPFTFWSAFVAQMLLRGKGVAEIERDGAGDVVALWLLPADRVREERDARGVLYFRYRGNAGDVLLDQADVLYVPYFSLDGATGQGVIDYARESIGRDKGIESAGSNHVNNMVRPSGAVTAPPGLTDQAISNIKESLRQQNAGHKQTGRLMFLQDGITFTPYQVTNEEAQWLESRAFSVLEVARFFSISPTKLADLSRATWGNIESENRAFYETTLVPITTPIGQECGRKLLTDRQRRTHYAEHVLDARLRGNTAERYAAHQTAIQSGWKTRNEVRQAENLPKLDGLDVPLAPVNMAQTNPPATPDPSAPDAADRDPKPEPPAGD